MNAILATAERTENVSSVGNYITARHQFAYEHIRHKLGPLVIELGSGNGYGITNLSGNCTAYIGVDKFLPPSIQLKKGCSMFRSRLPDLKNVGSNSYDTVICFQVIEHIKNDVRLCQEIYRILKPGGRLYLTTPNKLMSLTRNPYHVREYTPLTMQQLIESIFEHFSIQGIYGDQAVMNYYYQNKAQVDRITRWDLLNLQYRLPARLLQLPYNIANNINRQLLYRKNTGLAASLHHSNFFLSHVTDRCMDFFITATK
ncbi:class I SAM-dependent methyltransferase [Flavihumibacter sp. CACIAM 22H1]|uniref:class I SAM-dependent methyltransferase n=1 Tax=Flavihumibacter sp. CACIAM 22H1 TaxID=1812911 RepID=UPI0007A7D344|nr:class I SAM-dependent methyltransferase [Flavihumibacter sp. CACIAM 22H1]KYP12974.1 MAG: hypothetical protein A1D16_19540 [Flavihumibacter sp. CACIAM 22H1]